MEKPNNQPIYRGHNTGSTSQACCTGNEVSACSTGNNDRACCTGNGDDDGCCCTGCEDGGPISTGSGCGCCVGSPLLVFPGAFYIMMVTGGVLYALGGLYYIPILETFGQSNAMTSYVGSISHACLAGSGPLGSLMCDKLGVRATVCVGTLVATSGLVVAAFSNNFIVLLVAAGAVFGIGLGVVYLAALVIVNLTYTRGRVLLNGAMMAGVGVGNALYTLVFRWLLPVYGWRGTLLVTAGVTLNIAVAGAAMSQRLCVWRPSRRAERATHLAAAGATSSESTRATLRSLFADCRYLVVYVSAALYWFTMSAVLTHAPPKAVSHGLTLEEGASVMTVFGAGTTCGRLLLGALGQLPGVDNVAVCSLAYLASAAAVVGLGLCSTYRGLAFSMAAFAVTSAAFGTSFTETTMAVTGPARFSQGYGWLGIPMAVGVLFGAPASGLLYDLTGVYANSFYLPAATAATSGLLLLVLSLALKRSRATDVTDEVMADVTIVGEEMEKKAPLMGRGS